MNEPIASVPPLTLFDKIWRQHTVSTTGTVSVLAIDRIFLHERTGSVALKTLAEQDIAVFDRHRAFCTMDHIVDTVLGRGDDTRVPGGRQFITETRAAALAAGIRLLDVNDPAQGIVHVISPELGLALPGITIVCPDSHTCTQGALGAFAWGIGSSEAEEALATGALQLAKPKQMRVTFSGCTPEGVTAKDLSLALLARHGAAGGSGYVVEFAGTAVRAMEMEARLTLCNMAAEFAAVTGIIAPDEITLAYVEGRPFAPHGESWQRAVANWRKLRSDPGVVFERELEVPVAALSPMVTWGTSPAHAAAVCGVVPALKDSGSTSESYERALAYMDLKPGVPLEELPITGAFIGSCTNSRLSDLRRAAALLKGRHVASGVRALCVPGSRTVRRLAEEEGLDRVYRSAGFEWRDSGCSLCFFAGGESFGRRQRVISSTNRNFESRQGPETRTHIASSETVAASAIAGHIADPRRYLRK
jgi:3-isopropylmalate/(R)-2-methylmalate dehydratase large subunit